jgi:hypothetical protein
MIAPDYVCQTWKAPNPAHGFVILVTANRHPRASSANMGQYPFCWSIVFKAALRPHLPTTTDTSTTYAAPSQDFNAVKICGGRSTNAVNTLASHMALQHIASSGKLWSAPSQF